jgi:hypothetical protein
VSHLPDPLQPVDFTGATATSITGAFEPASCLPAPLQPLISLVLATLLSLLVLLNLQVALNLQVTWCNDQSLIPYNLLISLMLPAPVLLLVFLALLNLQVAYRSATIH